MRTAKWIFFGYLALVVLLVAGIAVSFHAAPPRDVDTIYLPLPDSIKTLDPAEVNDTLGGPLVGLVYESLYNYKYGVKPYTLFPELASAMPEVSTDGLVYTIHLRKGIHFFDPTKKVFPDGVGPELKASDVIYTLKRICDFNLASPNYSAFEDVFVGLDKWWDYTQHTAKENINWETPVEGLQVVDDYTIRLKLTKPNPQLIYHFAHEPTGVVCRQAVEKWGDEFRTHPVGTGPYALADNIPDQKLTYIANPLYRGKQDIDGTTPLAMNDPNRGPTIQRIEVQYFAEQLPIWLLFQQGLFDALSDIPKDSFTDTIENGHLKQEYVRWGVQLEKNEDPTLDYIAFNMQDKVLGKNKPLRQAMSMAFDRANYVQVFQSGRGIPANGLIPPGLPTYNAEEVNPYCQYNLAKAKELMVEAVKINGGPIPPMSLLMRGADTLSRQMAEYFVTQMAAIGVELRPEYHDWARYQEMQDNRQTQVFDSGWQGDYPDEQNFYQLLYSKNIPNAGLNAFCYNNPKFDALYEEATVLQDSPHRRDLYNQMKAIANEDCPAIWEYYIVRYVLKYDWLENYHYMDYGYGFRQYVRLDSKQRNKRFSQGDFRR